MQVGVWQPEYIYALILGALLSPPDPRNIPPLYLSWTPTFFSNISGPSRDSII